MEFREDEILQKRGKSTEIQSICSEASVFSMPNLPEELITEIMLRLPVKSLLQFRSVSKSWRSLISTSHFVKTHLLLSASNKDYIHHGVISKPSNTSRGVKDCSISSLLYDSVPESFELDNPGAELLGDSAKFVDGNFHWLDKHWNIISMDLAGEEWEEVDQPCCFKGCGFLKLGVFESDLSVFCNYAWTHVDVWVMKKYGVKESWTKMYTVKSPKDSGERIFYPIILMSKEGEILLKFGSRFVKYNPKDDSIRYLDVTKSAPCLEVQIYVKSLVCPFY